MEASALLLPSLARLIYFFYGCDSRLLKERINKHVHSNEMK